MIDGDTITATSGNERIRIRLLGIDAPELGTCGADAATDALKRQLEAAHTVTWRTDEHSDHYDRYGRLLAYIDTDGVDVGLNLINKGFVGAWWPSRAAIPTSGNNYQRAAKLAQEAGRGSWSTCGQVGH